MDDDDFTAGIYLLIVDTMDLAPGTWIDDKDSLAGDHGMTDGDKRGLMRRLETQLGLAAGSITDSDIVLTRTVADVRDLAFRKLSEMADAG